MSAAPLAIQRFEAIEARLNDIETGSTAVGDMRLFPFRTNALPSGWYHMNGDKYSTSSAQGLALAALPANYKTDWKITVASNLINLPTVYAADGRSYFERAVDGSTRQVGSVEGDAIRNIKGDMNTLATTIKNFSYNLAEPQPPFEIIQTWTANARVTVTIDSGCQLSVLDFDASRNVPTAAENRPLNVGKTPAIYLGV
jgi:hypothetical protein